MTPTLDLIRQRADGVKPTRVVVDSLAEMRLLAQDPLVYRRRFAPYAGDAWSTE